MHADDAVDPARGRVQCRGGHHGLGELPGVHLQAAVLLGCSRRIEPAAFMLLTVASGSWPIFSASTACSLKLVGHFDHPVDYPLGHVVS